MLSEFVFLDYVWRGLLLGTATATVFLVVMYFSPFFCKGPSHYQTKWYFNIHFAFLLMIFFGGFAFVSLSDPELATGCFTQFVKGGTSFAFTRYIAALWLLGSGAMISFDILKSILSMRRVRQFARIENQMVKAVLAEMAGRVGVHRSLDLCLTEAQTSPFVFGLMRHKIVLPQKFIETGDLETLRSVFAHELIHVRDHDSVWLSISLFCRRLLFFHPLVYLVSRNHGAYVEKAADEQAVLKGQVEARQLVRSLIEMVTFCRDTSPQPMKVNASRSFQEIKGRIEALHFVGRDHSRARFLSWMFGSMAIVVGFSFAQAEMNVVRSPDSTVGIRNMCTQVQHEMLIESWLKIEPEPVTCKK